MSESADPAHLVEILNDYFEQMVETIFKYEGTLDKFMGDGIMALWGAPVPRGRRPDPLCVLCPRQMEQLGKFNKDRLQARRGTARHRHRHPHRPARRRLHRQLEGALVHRHRRHREHERAALRGRERWTDHRERADARAARRRFEYKELPPAHLKGKEKPFKMFEILRTRLALQVPGNIATS